MAGNKDALNIGIETCPVTPVLAGGSSLAGVSGKSNSCVMDMLSMTISEMRKNNGKINQLKEAVCQGLVETRRYTDVKCASLKQDLRLRVEIASWWWKSLFIGNDLNNTKRL